MTAVWKKSVKRFFVIRTLVLASFLIFVHAEYAKGQAPPLENFGSVPRTLTYNYCDGQWYFSAWYKINNRDVNEQDISIEIDWGDGNGYISHPVTGFTITKLTRPGTTIIDTEINGMVFHQYPVPNQKEDCLYRIQVRLNVNGTILDDLGTRVYAATVWSRDRDGMGELSLVEEESGEEVYPICRGNTDNGIIFLNNSTLACNTSLPPDAQGDRPYAMNTNERYYQFRYYPTAGTGTDGNGIQDITIGGVAVTTATPYIGPVTRWPAAGQLAQNDGMMNALSEAMSLAVNNATVGARFTVECRMWNTCNPYTGDDEDNYDQVLGYIEIVEKPADIPERTTTYCYDSPVGNFNVNLNYDPGQQFKPGIYRWYRYDDDSPLAPSAASLATPILVVPNQPASPAAPPATTDAAQQINPTSGFPENFTSLPTHTSFPTHDNPSSANNNHRLNSVRPGHYRYWVTYEFSGKTGQAPNEVVYTCPTEPALMTWTVREDIRTAIKKSDVGGIKAYCSNELVTLTLPASIYPDMYEFGGLMEYVWTDPAVVPGSASGTGVTVSEITRSPGTETTAAGRTISFRVDPNMMQASGSSATVRLVVHRQWANLSSPGTGTGTNCPSAPLTIDITVNPRPTATLAPVTVDVCDGDMPTLSISNVAGGAGSTAFIYTLNDGTTGSASFPSKSSKIDVKPKQVTAPAVTEYFIYTIKDDATGCVSTNEYSNASTRRQLIPYGPAGGAGAPIQVTWRANMNSPAGTYDPPADIVTPVDNSLLCSNQPRTFDVGTAPAAVPHPGKDVSVGGAPATDPDDKSINTQYQWSWTSQSSAAQWTTGTTQTYSPSINGTVTRAQGEIYVLRLYREYIDQKCGQTTTRRWTYTIIPNPTATISPQTIELCENDDPARILTVTFTTTGYIAGDWTVGYQLLSHNGTTVLPTVQTTANATQTITPGNGNGTGTINIPLSELNGTPKYGNYTVKLTSVVQNTTANPTCPGTVSGTQTITLRRKPEATLSGGPGIICEGKDYTLMSNNSVALTGEPGVDYAITYETRDNEGGLLGNNIVVNPLIDGRFNVSQAYIDQTDALNITTIQLLTVSQSYGSYTCSNDADGTHTIQIDKNPLKAEIPVDRIDVCDEEADITANDPAGFPNHRWYIDATTLPPDAVGTTDYGFEGTYQPESELHNTTFSIRDQKYGQYKLYWEISATGGLGVCTASRDSVIVNLATHAQPSVITTLPVITCNNTIILQTDKTLNSWETSVWSVVVSPSAGFTGPFQLPGAGYGEYDRMITVPQSGTYIFQYEKQVPSGCDGTLDQVSITVGDNPVVEWDGLKEGSATPYPYYCPGEPIDVTFKETSNKGIPSGQITYTWTTSDAIGNYLEGGTQQGALLHVDKAPANATNAYMGYTVNNIRAVNTITVTDAGYPAPPPPPTSLAPSPVYPDYADKTQSCLSSPAKSFTIQVKPTPAFEASSINVCPGEEIVYKLVPELASATATNTVWDWQNVTAAPAIKNAGLATPATPPSGKTATFTPVQSKTYDANNEFLVAEPNNITLQVTVEGCPSSVVPFIITINPTPVPSITGRETQPLCPLTDDKLVFNNVVDSARLQYTWNYTGAITYTSLESNDKQEERFHLTYSSSENLTSNDQTSHITVTAYGDVKSDISTEFCSATSTPYPVMVSPRPNMDALTPQQMCGTGGSATFNDVLFNVSNRGTRTVDYTWTNVRNTDIAGVDQNETTLSQTTASYSGTGTVAGIRGILIPENYGDTTMVASIRVTPTMTRDNGILPGCAGIYRDVVLTVLPRPVVNSIPNDTVCAEQSFKTIYPRVENTDISKIVFSTPTPGLTYVTPQGDHTVNTIGTAVNYKANSNNTGGYLSTVVIVRATGDDLPTGSTVGCVGPDSTFVLVVRPTPVITAPLNNALIQELCPGEDYNPVTFTSNINASHQPPRNADVIFTWVVQDYDIGSGGNGTVTGNGGQTDIFKGIANTTGSKITSTIRVTAELEGCNSPPVKFLQRLKPTPQMNPIDAITKCPEETVPVIGITHNVGGGTTGILWEVDNDDVELAPDIGNKAIAAGITPTRIAGNTPQFTTNINNTLAPIVSEFLVTAVVENCNSDTVKYKVIVNPSPNIERPQWMTEKMDGDTLFVCHKDMLEDGIVYTSPSFPDGFKLEWWRTPENITETSPGVQLPTGSNSAWRDGDIPKFQAVNPTVLAAASSEVTSTFIVRTRTTSEVGCPSQPDTFAITVGAVPKIGVTNPVFCADPELVVDKFTTTVDPSGLYELGDTVYNWKLTSVTPNGWSSQLGLPDIEVAQTGHIATFNPDLSTDEDTYPNWDHVLWGTEQQKITIETYVTLKKSDISGLGCPSETKPMLITINPKPITDIRPNVDKCVTDGRLVVYQTVDNPPGSDYEWGWITDTSDPSYAQFAPTIPAMTPEREPFEGVDWEVYEYPTPAGVWVGKIIVQERNVFGCRGAVAELEMNTIPAPQVVVSTLPIDGVNPITDKTSVCSGNPFHVYATIDGSSTVPEGVTLDWFPQPEADQSLQPEYVYTLNAQEDREIWLRAENGGCLSDRKGVTVTVYPLPRQPKLTGQTYCTYEENWAMNVDLTSIQTGNHVEWYRFDDDLNDYVSILNTDPNQTTVNMNSLTEDEEEGVVLTYTNSLDRLPDEYDEDITIVYAVKQAHTYTVASGSLLTCASNPASAQMILRIAPEAPIPVPAAYCEDTSWPFYNLTVNQSSGTFIEWFNVPDPVFPINQSQHVGSGNEINVPQMAPSAIDTDESPGVPATYEPFLYYAVATSTNGCRSIPVPVPLTIYPAPETSFTLSDIDGNDVTGGCAPFLLVATNTSPSEFATYEWTWAPGETEDAGLYGDAAHYTYRVNGTIPEAVRLQLTAVSTEYSNYITGVPCTSTKSTTLIITPGVKADFIASMLEGCNPVSALFTATGISQGAYNYRWYWDTPTPPAYTPGQPVIPHNDPNNNNPAADSYFGYLGANPQHVFENTDNPDVKSYHVWLQVDNGACFDNKDITINVYAVPNSDINLLDRTGGNSFCPPDSVMFENSSSGFANTINTEYLWNFADGSKIEITDYTKTKHGHAYQSWNASAPLSYTVSLSAVNTYQRPGLDDLSCGAIDLEYIHINPQVEARFTGPLEGCSPDSVNFLNQSIGAVSTYEWNFGDGSPSPGNVPNPSHRFENTFNHNQVMEYDVRLIAGNGYGCKDTVTQIFRLYPQPVASFSIPKADGCQPFTVVFTNTSDISSPLGPNRQTGMTYTYDFRDGYGEVNPDTRTVTHPFSNSLGVNLTMTPTLTARNEWGCISKPYEQTITVYPFLNADFIMEDSIGCSPLTTTFRNASAGFYEYNYDFGDGTVLPGDRTSSAQSAHTFNNPTMYQDSTYTVTLTVRAGVCDATVSRKVKVYSTPKADFRPGGTNYFYPAPPITLDNLIPLPDRDNMGAYLWSWSEQRSDYQNNFSTAEYPTPLRISEWGIYNITQRVTAKNGICFDSKTLSINIHPQAAIAGFEDVPPACMPYKHQFVNTSRYAQSYFWEFGDGFTSTAKDPLHTYTDAGSYQVTLTVTGYGLDQNTYTNTVTVHPLPQADFKVSPSFLWVGQPLRAFNYTQSDDKFGMPYDVWYSWDWGDNSAKDTAFSPTHMYMKAGSYNITLTVGTLTSPECVTSVTKPGAVDLENSGDLILPNVFTPSESGEPSDYILDHGYRNYLFYPPVLTPVEKYHFMIFTRWGQLIYETHEPNRGWTGYFNGRLCDEGVYIYRIEGVFQTGQSFIKVGDITLLR